MEIEYPEYKSRLWNCRTCSRRRPDKAGSVKLKRFVEDGLLCAHCEGCGKTLSSFYLETPEQLIELWNVRYGKKPDEL